MLKIKKNACKTCIYGNNTPFKPGYLKQLEAQVADPNMKGFFRGYRACHDDTIKHGDDSVCCRGFWNKHKDKFDAGQIAQRLNLIKEVD